MDMNKLSKDHKEAAERCCELLVEKWADYIDKPDAHTLMEGAIEAIRLHFQLHKADTYRLQ